MKYLFILLISYFIGSIPFAYIITKIFGRIDIRTKGSGNVGATNVARTAGFLPGILVLLLDLLKGFLAVKITYSIAPELIYWAGLAVIVGHCWTIFLKFQGGKGVATTLGVMLALKPVYILYLLLVWIGIFIPFQIVSLSSIIAALSLPLILVLKGAHLEAIVFVAIYSAIIILRHKVNIRGLLRGEEKRFSIFRK